MIDSQIDYGPEWELLELICFGLVTPDHQDRVRTLVGEKQLHWGELLDQALRHKMMPLLAGHIVLNGSEKLVPKFIADHLQTVLDLNRWKTTIFRREAARIITALNKNKIRFVATKGITFESTLYEGNGSRFMSDMDFMILPEQREQVFSALTTLGYQMGQFDWHSATVRPHARKEMLIYQMSPDHLPAFAIGS